MFRVPIQPAWLLYINKLLLVLLQQLLLPTKFMQACRSHRSIHRGDNEFTFSKTFLFSKHLCWFYCILSSLFITHCIYICKQLVI